MMQLLPALRKTFSLDVRSVALFRVGVGGMIMLDLLLRIRDLGAHYTDEGILPRESVSAWIWNTDLYSLHMLGGEIGLQIFLFLVAGGMAGLLLVGKWPKLSLLLSWVLLLSLHARNPVILDGGDVLLRSLIFWLLFIPLSTPVSTKPVAAPSYQLFSVATVAMFIQIMCVYLFSGWLKTGETWQNGTAVYYVMNLDMHTTGLGKQLLSFPTLMESITSLTVWIERWAVLLLLLGGLHVYIRYASVLLFISLHLGFALTLKLGLFPFIGMLCWLIFLPPHFWEKGLGKHLLFIVATKPSGFMKKLDQQAYSWAFRVGKFFQTGLILFSLYLMLGWNALSVGKEYLSPSLDPVVMKLGLNQNWNLFSPDPIRNDGWYVVVGVGEEGSYDYWNLQDVSFLKPASVSSTYRNQRWRKYWKQIKKRRYKELKPYLGRYFCQQERDILGGNAPDSLHIYYMQERSMPFGQEIEVKSRVLWASSCPQPINKEGNP
ncbi:MAG: hypothetical protein AAF824_04205 [Bacteroidota bacterium]